MTSFISTFNDYLQRVRTTYPQIAPLLDHFLDNASIATITPIAVEKMKLTQSDGESHSSLINKNPHYIISALCQLIWNRPKIGSSKVRGDTPK